ncbi:MAG TPA: DUF433 domain-containing protein [Pyrinomonadaceae bacterium]|nr:DUF433 domain-containing protein [Pyrinomonadaceae bacterium]
MGREILIQRSEELLGGTPVFAGTRVPVQTLFDYIEEATCSTSSWMISPP